MKQKNLIIVVGVVLIFSDLNVTAQDWPDWRGANRDGMWNETGVVEKFRMDSLPPVWSFPLGAGYSGSTVATRSNMVTPGICQPAYFCAKR